MNVYVGCEGGGDAVTTYCFDGRQIERDRVT